MTPQRGPVRVSAGETSGCLDGWGGLLGFVDPDGVGDFGCLGWSAKSFGVFGVGGVENALACLSNRFGNLGDCFSVLNCDSENGLSFDTLGRECDWRIPRSARSWVTVFDVIDNPRSAWIASWP